MKNKISKLAKAISSVIIAVVFFAGCSSKFGDYYPLSGHERQGLCPPFILETDENESEYKELTECPFIKTSEVDTQEFHFLLIRQHILRFAA